jgi:hypothetical protein
MKTSGLLLLSVTLSIMTALTNLGGAEGASVTIQYVHPEGFTDFNITVAITGGLLPTSLARSAKTWGFG